MCNVKQPTTATSAACARCGRWNDVSALKCDYCSLLLEPAQDHAAAHREHVWTAFDLGEDEHQGEDTGEEA